MYQRILVATDGSELSQKAVRHALALAKLSGAELVAMKVVPVYPRTYLEGGATTDNSEIARVEADWVAQAQATLDEICTLAASQGVRSKTTITKSDLIAEAIMASAQEHAVDLIVMASHGRKGIKRLLLGSETQQVLTHSTVPVLVLR